jgi:hypothetical protein
MSNVYELDQAASTCAFRFLVDGVGLKFYFGVGDISMFDYGWTNQQCLVNNDSFSKVLSSILAPFVRTHVD